MRTPYGTRFKLSLLAVSLMAVVAAACGSDSEALSAPQAPDGGTEHVEVGADHEPYGTVPATSGPHWSTFPSEKAPFGSPVVWGVYDQAIADEALVHNLEHGGIGLHYDCPEGCPDLVTRLVALVPADPSQFVMSPYPDMPSRIAVTAWRRVMYFDEMDQETISAFIKSYQDKAPESVPANPSALGSDCGPTHSGDGESDSAPAIGGSCSQ
ncbi:MAG: DUF3105 domain-containing protein [Chloroflexi bacterium]|nr:DUF3105 domain-containing protein [Chloroflexota bacterium]